jgi:hypothetical protein
LEDFLRLWTAKESSISRWATILDDDMTLELPGASASQSKLSGVADIMKGSEENCMVFGGSSCSSIQYHQDTFLMEGTNAVMDWTATCADHSQRVSAFSMVDCLFRGVLH